MPFAPLTTQIVGSYSKPHWLAHHQRSGTYDGSWWRPDPDVLDAAREDVARLSIYEQERAGLDLLTDGEPWRAGYDRHFLFGLDGVDLVNLAPLEELTADYSTRKQDDANFEKYSSHNKMGPRIIGPVSWNGPITVKELRFLKETTDRKTKANVAGPLTLSHRVSNGYYPDRAALVRALATALNHEMRALQEAGADVLQIDEPGFHSSLSFAQDIGEEALSLMVAGITVPVIVHVCYGYALVYKEKSASEIYPKVLELLAGCPIDGMSIEYEQPGHTPALLDHCGDKHVVLGLLDLSKSEAETPEHIAQRLRAALEVVPAGRLHPASDCGMWYLPRDLAYRKIVALAEGTAIVRREIGATAP